MHFRQTLRNLSRTPGFSLTVVLVMALGIGATTALFTVVNSVLMRPLPLADSDRLVRAWEATPAKGHIHSAVAGGTWELWRDQNTLSSRWESQTSGRTIWPAPAVSFPST